MLIAQTRYGGLWILALSGMLLANTRTWADDASKAGTECLAGAALVTFTGCMLFKKNDPTHRMQCLALAGALGAGGGLVCYSYSKNLEKRQKALSGHENDLQSQINYVHGLNQDTQNLNADLAKKISDVSANTDQLVAKIQQGTEDQQSLAAARKALDNEVAQAQDQVTKGNLALDKSKQFRATQTTPSPELDAAIAEQEQLLASAKQEVEQLAAQRARV